MTMRMKDNQMQNDCLYMNSNHSPKSVLCASFNSNDWLAAVKQHALLL